MKRFVLALTFSLLGSLVFAQKDSLQAAVLGEPIIIQSDTLFSIYGGIGSFTVHERAEVTVKRIHRVQRMDGFSVDSIYVNLASGEPRIYYKDELLLSVTKEDAEALSLSLTEATDYYLAQLKKQQTTENFFITNWKIFVIRILLMALSVLLIYGAMKLINKGFVWVTSMVDRIPFPAIRFTNYEFITAERVHNLALLLLKGIRILFLFFLFYLALPAVFSIFPATQGLAEILFSYVLNPAKSILYSILKFIPNLFSIGVIVVVFHYFIRFLGFLSSEIASEKLVVSGFYPEWSKPTFLLLRFILYAFMFILIFPYLPGSDSPVFRGVSVFLGLLISLGSSSAIGNLIAGLVITYMRPFKIGDRVKIGDTVGDVLEKTILVTRILTIKNEEITIPNANILSGHTINYTAAAKTHGLILHTTITIGYDVPWRQVHELLLSAAKKTALVSENPAPFVLQTSLDDFFISYQLNAPTHHPEKGAVIYSELHQNIQDNFRDANVEILSPHYRAERDGNPLTVPRFPNA